MHYPTPNEEPLAGTAGEQDHTDPAALTGGPAVAPADCGHPPAGEQDPSHAGIAAALLPPWDEG